MATDDVPSPIDFHDPQQAREWVEWTVQNRPYRPLFFDAFVGAINRRCTDPVSVLELGSGPGHLAEQILSRCKVARYLALDFSAVMHDLAGTRLQAFVDRVEFVQLDFRPETWTENLGVFDAVVTMQAAHETRHRRHLVPLLARARQLIRPKGLLLYCDHYFEPGNGQNPELMAARAAQPVALSAAGCSGVELLLDSNRMALYAAIP